MRVIAVQGTNLLRLCLLTLSGAMAAPLACGQSDSARALAELHTAAKLKPDRANGDSLYRTCATCHGSNGRGSDDGEFPAIAGQHGSVLLKQLVDFRHDRRWNRRMQQFTDAHHLPSSQDVTDVAAHVASMPRFPATTDGIGDGRELDAGARVYFKDCESCHGPLGEGDALRFRPRLAGQHYQYLLRQMNDIAIDARPGIDIAHVERFRRLSTQQRRGIADYLSRLSPNLSSHPPRDPASEQDTGRR